MENYRVCRHLMEGSTCQVKLAKHLVSNEQVCLKVMSKKHNSRKSVSNEVGIMRHLETSGAGTLKLLNYDENKDAYILIIEYMDGGDLYEYVSRYRRELPHAVQLCRQLVKEVKACHDAGVAHCDIKPENILLGKDGRVKLADYGLSIQNNALTTNSCGTLDYVAPEVFLDVVRPYDPKTADIFSLGAVMYAILTGFLPGGSDPFDRAGPRFKGVSAVKDERARNLVESMMTADPEQRISLPDVLAHPFLE